jgi:PAS domain S-box-containing protein
MSLEATIGIISAAGAAVWGAWIKVLRPAIKKMQARRREREEDRKKLDYLVKEMTVDQNGSMKTAVMKLQSDMADNHKITGQILDRLDDIDENQKLGMNLQGVRFWVSNTEGSWTYVSPELCKLLGRSESELLGRNWFAVIVHEDRQRIIDAIDFSAENESGFDEIFTIRRPDGLYIKVWAVALPRAGRKIFGGTMGKMDPLEAPHAGKNSPI